MDIYYHKSIAETDEQDMFETGHFTVLEAFGG